MEKKQIYINGMPAPINGERNILEICRKQGIDIPTFCYHSKLSIYGGCRLCMVDIEGRGIQASCSIVPEDGMKIKTHTADIREIRKTNLELLLANHKIDCPVCIRANNCQLQDLSRLLGVHDVTFKKTDKTAPIDDLAGSIVKEPNKCVLCGDCVRVCSEIQSVGVLEFTFRGSKTQVASAFNKSLDHVECINCGQCVIVCPTGSLTIKKEIDEVWEALSNKDKHVVVQIAPAVRVALSEMFNGIPGTIGTGKLVTALRIMGFDQVYDTSFGADLTIFEEATEFLQRRKSKGKFPMFTSCCPSWVKFTEQYFPDLIPNLSTTKSPIQIMSAVAKERLPKMLGIKPKDLVMVSIVPCTAKKYEAKRVEFQKQDIPYVDHTITTVEFGNMITEMGINFNALEDQEFDMPLGFKSGAGVLFGNSGGVAEATMRYAYEKLTGERLRDVHFNELRGSEGIREATIKMGEESVKVGVIHGLANARKVAKSIQKGECDYDFIEFMACPGGCINGGGQPISNDPEYLEKRKNSIYSIDKSMQIQKPQDNHELIDIVYTNFLDEPGSDKAHELLHTHFRPRRRIVEHIALS